MSSYFGRSAALIVCGALLALAALSASPPSAAAADCTITSSDAVIVGTSRSDVICVTGPGTHIVYGGLLDDDIYGGDGNDLLIGGHGTDLLHGGPGDDVLRGGTNRDCYVGGLGNDTASFASMTPTNASTTAGVTADLDEELADSPDDPIRTCKNEGFAPPGRADGEGVNEGLASIENLVGSAFDDDLEAANTGQNNLYGGFGDDFVRGRSGSGPIDDLLRGEVGNDSCRNSGNAVACSDGPEGSHRPSGPFAFAENRGLDSGVVVMAREGTANDTLGVTRPSSSQVRVTAGETLTATANCSLSGSQTLNCNSSTPRYVVVWGSAGNDNLSIGSGFPTEASLDLNGGPGSDVVNGNSNSEILFTGEGGTDQLNGGAGTDALISQGDPVGSGGDTLDGGDGNDQLVTDNACAGHVFIPGSDTGSGAAGDIVGFAQQKALGIPGGGPRGVHAELGEGATTKSAYATPEPTGCARSSIYGGGEILEGTDQADKLIGNGAPNEIWGRDGIDEVFGMDGNDIVHGHGARDTVYGNAGDDTVWGEEGQDDLFGGDGSDRLRALDGVADFTVNCGGGLDYAAQADTGPVGPTDPVMSCNEL
jgi:Ca2+-binding RTX toxin-like protein